MRIRTIKTCMKDGVKSIVRNGLMSIASIGTISACLLILGLTYCIVMNVQQLTKELDSSLGIVAFLAEGTTDAQAKELTAQLQDREEVKSARYVSPEEAWEEFKETLKNDSEYNNEILDELDTDNPLSNSSNIEIYLNNSRDQETLVEELRAHELVRSVNYSQKAADMMTTIAKFATYIGLALMGVLMLIAILLIANTIKLSVYIRRNEISIMKYIGAKDSFIRLPFIVEGMLIGLLGVIIPSGLIYLGYYYIIKIVNEKFTSMSYLLTFVETNEIMRGLLPIFLILSICVGMIGSMISIRKHLRV